MEMSCCQKACQDRCGVCTKLSGQKDPRTVHSGHKCDRILHCQHQCGQDCTTDHRSKCGSDDCKQPCRQTCDHHECKKGCSTPCTPCMMQCSWACDHHTCEVICGAVRFSLPFGSCLLICYSPVFDYLAICDALALSSAGILVLLSAENLVMLKCVSNAPRRSNAKRSLTSFFIRPSPILIPHRKN